MELRNHPVMFCDGVKVWPPKWLLTYGPGSAVLGEIGVLEAVFLSQVILNKVYLIMHTEADTVYIGTLMFEKSDCAKTVFEFFNKQINKPLANIGAMDLPENFGH